MQKLHFIAAETEVAQKAMERLIARYGQASFEECDVIVVLGGDGTILHSLQKYMGKEKPIFGMNKGSVGFLMNNYAERDLHRRISRAEPTVIHPLRVTANFACGRQVELLAFNEVSLFRQSYQAAKIAIEVDGKLRMKELICDGVMVASPAGSTAYNLSAFGPILPLTAPLMALTPVSPFRPRRWHGALLSNSAKVRLSVLEQDKRPVNLAADNIEIKSIDSALVSTDRSLSVTLLFDASHSWEERIIKEQFAH